MHCIRLLVLAAAVPAVLASQPLYFPPLTGAAWETRTPATLGWNTGRIDTLYFWLESQNSRAFLVIKDGRIVMEKYFGTFTQDSAWYWASAGKTITAFVVGLAQQQGLLSIGDAASKWLGAGWTGCPPDKEALITVRHQLTMTSGLDDSGDPYCTVDTCLTYRADAGTRWAYHNAPYTLLDSVVTVATGENFNVYVNRELSAKIGMRGLFFRSGFNNVYGSTARSMARFGLLILNRGAWDTTPVMTDTAYFNAMVTTSQQFNRSYGYLWWLNGKESFMLPQSQFVFPGPACPDAPADMIAALGKNGQILNVAPSQGLIVVRLGDAPDNSPVPVILNNDIWKLLNDVIGRTPTSQGVPTRAPGMSKADGLRWTGSALRYRVTTAGPVVLRLYDATGRVVAEPVRGFRAAGEYEAGIDDRLPAGTYCADLTVANGMRLTAVVPVY